MTFLNPRFQGYAHPALVGLFLAGSLLSCAAPGPKASEGIETNLAAAGFTRTVASTPRQLDQYRTLPQRRLVPYSKGGATYYVYADAERCRCVYEGDEAAHRRFQAASGSP